METNGKDNRAEARKAKRKKQVLMGKIVIAVLVLIIAALCFFLIKGVLGKKNNTNGTSTSGNKQTESQSGASQTTESETQKVTEAPEEDLVAKADRLAAMYDYDAAIDLLKIQQDMPMTQHCSQKYRDTKRPRQPAWNIPWKR